MKDMAFSMKDVIGTIGNTWIEYQCQIPDFANCTVGYVREPPCF